MPDNPYGWPVDPIEPLTWMTERLNSRSPFCYIRFNDGEAYSMSGLKLAPETNGEHVYSDRMRQDLAKTFISACAESVDDPRVLVGSWWYEDPGHLGADWIYTTLNEFGGNAMKGLADEVRWGRGHIWHREELEREGKCLGPELLGLIDSIKKHCVGSRVLVGPPWLAPVAYALLANHVVIPPVDAGQHPGTFSPPFINKSDQLVIWCAGFPAKAWMWDSWTKRSGFHIDAGSLFDGLVGRESREWLKKSPETAHSKFYYNEFARHLGIKV